MITIDSMATRIEEGLNASASAYKFKFRIFVDAGKFERAKNTRTSKHLYINSLLRVGESSIIPVQGIVIATQSAVLEVCVPIFKDEQIDEATTLFRNMLDEYFATYKVQTIDGYTVSSTYSLASTGTLEARGIIGPSLTFYVNMEFAYMQNGLNSQNCTFMLKSASGQVYALSYSSAKITKTPVTHSDAYSNSSGRGGAVNASFVRGYEFQIPAQTDGIGSDLISLLMNSDLDSEWEITVTIGSVSWTVAVIFGGIDMVLEGIQNAGFNIAFTEAPNGNV